MEYIYSIIMICLFGASCGLLPDRTPPEEVLKNIGSVTLCEQGFAVLNPKGDRVYVLDHDLKTLLAMARYELHARWQFLRHKIKNDLVPKPTIETLEVPHMNPRRFPGHLRVFDV